MATPLRTHLEETVALCRETLEIAARGEQIALRAARENPDADTLTRLALAARTHGGAMAELASYQMLLASLR
jgi:hypothetical protein